MHSWTLYQTESLELLRLNCHHSSNATYPGLSAVLLHSYVWVIAGFWIFTTPASQQARQMFAQTVVWHHTPLNICSSALHAQHNWQLKTYGTIQMRWLIFSSSTTTNEGEELWLATTTTTVVTAETNRLVSVLAPLLWVCLTLHFQMKERVSQWGKKILQA